MHVYRWAYIKHVCVCVFTYLSLYPQHNWLSTSGASIALITAYAAGYTEAPLIPALAWLLFKQTSQKSWAACHSKETIYVRFWAGESVRAGEEGGGESLKVVRETFHGPYSWSLFPWLSRGTKQSLFFLGLPFLSRSLLKASGCNGCVEVPVGTLNESECHTKELFASSLDGFPQLKELFLLIVDGLLCSLSV